MLTPSQRDREILRRGANEIKPSWLSCFGGAAPLFSR